MHAQVDYRAARAASILLATTKFMVFTIYFVLLSSTENSTRCAPENVEKVFFFILFALLKQSSLESTVQCVKFHQVFTKTLRK